MDVTINAKVVAIPVSEIKPYDGSHKTNGAVALIKESIQRYGITQPISIDRSNTIITGNGVYHAAVELGIKELPCIVVDYLPPEKVAEYRLADNLTGGFARWNEDKLRRELSYLQSPDDMQVFFDDNISKMLAPDDLIVAVSSSSARSFVENGKAQSPASSSAKNDDDFKQSLKDVERDLEAKSVEYFRYKCSGCGKDVTVRLK